VRQLNRQGMTIFLTTQYMEEADRLANRLCIVDQGKIVAEGTPDELKAQIGADVITLKFQADDLEACQKASEALSKLEGVKEVGICGVGITRENGLTVMAQNGSALIPQVVRAVDVVGVKIEQLTLSVPTLDEVFLKLTGRTLNVVERKESVRARGWGGRRRGQ
jgi:ABC-2 type transport system ATP-binding protein